MTSAASLIDTHCHIDLYPSPEKVVAEAEAAGIRTIAVTNAPSVFFHTKALAQGLTFVRAAVGLHPELVRTHGGEVEKIAMLLDETRYVGEIGLDYVTPDKQEQRRQQEVFAKILEYCAAYGDKVLTVHTRRSATDAIAAIGDHFPGKVILHWFSGSAKDLRTAIGYGMYFSVNPAMIRSKNGQALIAEMPKDRVLTETDGPFVKVGKEPARPPHVADAVAHLATVWQVSPDEARAVVANNLERAVGVF